jgi:hypothetical protein
MLTHTSPAADFVFRILQVMEELGYTAERIAELRRMRVI